MKFTTLIENTSEYGLISEHGLCIYIEFENKKYLLDTGASDKFINNAKSLNINLKSVDACILSHAHYDHSGGYESFFNINSHAKVYLREESKELCYRKSGAGERYIGIPNGLLKNYSNRFIYVSDDFKIDEGVWLISHKFSKSELKGQKSKMFRKNRDEIKFDDFKHEHSLVFELEKGLVIFNSCCHIGVDNIVKEVMQTFPTKKVFAIIGGFHLKGSTGIDSMGVETDEVIEIADNLLNLGVRHIYTGHCTGKPAYKILKDILGDKINYISSGSFVEF